MKRLFLICGALTLGLSPAQAFTLTVFHVNDTHSRIEPAMVGGKEFGGMARLSTLAQRIRKSEPNVLFLHAGDAFQGTLYYNVYKGTADGLVLSMLGIDAMALGNHEFDDGPEGLLPFTRQVGFPLLCSNIDFSKEPDLQKRIEPWRILKVGRDRVGVIGVMTPDLPFIANMGPNLAMTDLDAAIRSSIEALKKQRINKIILLSHVGYELDRELATRHPELDIIVGGHSHSYLGNLAIQGFPAPMGSYPEVIGSTMIVQAWEWAKVAGLLQVDFDRSGRISKIKKATPIPVDDTITPDPRIETVVTALRKPIQALQNQPVGNTTSGITRDGTEKPMGNLIADAQLAAAQQQKAVIALMNPGGIRASIEPGTITYGEVISVQPFNNTLVVIDLTGAELLACLEIGAANNRILQVSRGMSYEVDLGLAAGSRVVRASLNGVPISPGTTYRVVVNSFLSKGGDNFTPLKDAKGYRLDTGSLDVDALIKFIQTQPNVSAQVEGRVVVRGG